MITEFQVHDLRHCTITELPRKPLLVRVRASFLTWRVVSQAVTVYSTTRYR